MPYSITSIALSMRLAAISFFAGLAVLFLFSLFHPADAPAHVSHLAFAEYADSKLWTDTHVGQFIGAFLIILGFAGLRERLCTDAPLAAALSRPAVLSAAATLSSIAILQAVDGPALKHAVVQWHSMPIEDADPAFRVAEAVRWIEIGINSYFRLLLGLTLVLFGAALAASQLFPRWLGWLGISGGAGSVLQGLYVGHYGFDATAIPAIGIPSVLYFGWFIAMAIVLWRDAARLSCGEATPLASGNVLALPE